MAFSADGTQLWKRVLGTTYSFDNPNWTAVAIDPTGNAVITGKDSGKSYAASFTPDGTLQWRNPLPTSFGYKADLAADATGHIVIASTIDTSEDRGYIDAYLAKYLLP